MTNMPVPTPPPVSAVKYSTGEPADKPGNGSGWILAVCILQFIGGLIMYATAAVNSTAGNLQAIAVLVITMMLAAIFFGLWLWGRKAPFPALLTALIVYVTFHLFDAVLDPATLFRGLIMKIVILVGLSSAINKAYVARRRKEEETAAP